jgi:two-component system, cell cycle sensor histidine kinase and response regulator CckA
MVREIPERGGSSDVAAPVTPTDSLRHIVETAQDLIYYCDPAGHFTYVNPAAARVMRYSKEELIGRHFLTLIHPSHQSAAADFYTRQLLDQKPNTYFEFIALTKDGEKIWIGQHVQLVYDGDRIAGVHAIARDITRQKAVEQLLRGAETQYRSLMQGAAYGMYLTTIDGRIRDANPALVRMLRYDSVDDLRSHTMADIYESPADRATLVARMSTVEYGGVDVRWKRKDGSPFVAHLSARRVEFPDGTPGFEGIAEDITERQSLEQQLRRAQRMEAIGRLARGVAHDFNNVLAAILGSSDLLQYQLKEGDPARQEAEEIRKAAERGAALTHQLLSFARNHMLEPVVLDVNLVVMQQASALKQMAGDRVAVRVHPANVPLCVKVEPGQLEQMLVNLVSNSCDAMPEGGTIDIEISPLSLSEQRTQFPGMPAGEYVRIAVRDTGCGIAADLQPHVFERFFTTKAASKGTGLGLSIVHGIAKDAGGMVTFTSEPGKGTTFDVLLPRHDFV